MVLFVGAWNHNSFNNFMSVNLFRVMKPPPTWFTKNKMKDGANPDVIGKERIELKARPNCIDFIKQFLPKLCHCCRLSRRERVLVTARGHLKQEINIFSIIRMRRYIMRAIKELLPR